MSPENQQEERNSLLRTRLKAKVAQVRKYTFQAITSEGKVNLIIINITCLVCLYIGLGLVNVPYSFGIFWMFFSRIWMLTGNPQIRIRMKFVFIRTNMTPNYSICVSFISVTRCLYFSNGECSRCRLTHRCAASVCLVGGGYTFHLVQDKTVLQAFSLTVTYHTDGLHCYYNSSTLIQGRAFGDGNRFFTLDSWDRLSYSGLDNCFKYKFSRSLDLRKHTNSVVSSISCLLTITGRWLLVRLQALTSARI